MRLLLVYGRLRERGGLRAAVEALTEELRKNGVETEPFSPLKTENLLCSGCGACSAVCPSGIETADIMRGLKKYKRSLNNNTGKI